jgi:predicted dienelactone hydrolase
MKMLCAKVMLAGLLLGAKLGAAEVYDPLKVAEAAVESKTFEVNDVARSRTIPVRVYLPADKKPVPVVLFSHGLGGSRDNNPYLGEHWAKRGYVVVFMQHIGSDESVWKDAAALERMTAMRQAASAKNYIDRTQDVPAVLDALAKWNAEKGHPLHGRMDLEKVGMSGHSFGAQTTQVMAGQSAGRISLRDPRVDAAVMMSPSPPARGDAAAAFATVKIPCLLMTGTLDDSPIGNTTPADRLKVFPHLKEAPAWQVVFDKATHMDFGQRDLRGGKIKDSRYHRAILALTTAFWDAELNDKPEALKWLNDGGAKKVLLPEDRWEKNGKAAGPAVKP